MVQQRRARATRNAILQGAATVFLAHGYRDSSLDEVAEASGVTKGALYFHFRSKGDLANAVVVEQHRRSREYTDLVAEGSPRAAEAMMLTCASFATQLTSEVMVAAGIRLSTEAPADELTVAPAYLDWLDEMTRHIGAAVVEGDFRPDLDVERAARFVVGAYTGVQTLSALTTGRSDVFERLRDMMSFVLPSFVSPRSAGLAATLTQLIKPTHRPPVS